LTLPGPTGGRIVPVTSALGVVTSGRKAAVGGAGHVDAAAVRRHRISRHRCRLAFSPAGCLPMPFVPAVVPVVTRSATAPMPCITLCRSSTAMPPRRR